MKLTMRPFRNEEDFWRVRNFLREIFLLHDRIERGWNVARLDYWRWHLMANLQVYPSMESALFIWETGDGKIAALLNGIVKGEARLHLHPEYRSLQLQDEMLAQAEADLFTMEDDTPFVYLPVDSDDSLLHETLLSRGYEKNPGRSNKWRRDLDAPVPDVKIPAGYIIRSMGGEEEHPARGWASWRSFHSEEPDENYDGDFSWIRNMQSAPLYRRDLDVVAVTLYGEIASFCTIYYDDYTRSAVCVLVGTAAEHWQRGLGKAVIFEGMKRLQRLGCTRVFATAYDPPANALYGAAMNEHQVAETWLKVLK